VTDEERRCQRGCGRKADIFDLDGCWCSPLCRELDAEVASYREWDGLLLWSSRPKVLAGGDPS
jgi:hypothetical protein